RPGARELPPGLPGRDPPPRPPRAAGVGEAQRRPPARRDERGAVVEEAVAVRQRPRRRPRPPGQGRDVLDPDAARHHDRLVAPDRLLAVPEGEPDAARGVAGEAGGAVQPAGGLRGPRPPGGGPRGPPGPAAPSPPPRR